MTHQTGLPQRELAALREDVAALMAEWLQRGASVEEVTSNVMATVTGLLRAARGEHYAVWFLSYVAQYEAHSHYVRNGTSPLKGTQP